MFLTSVPFLGTTMIFLRLFCRKYDTYTSLQVSELSYLLTESLFLLDAWNWRQQLSIQFLQVISNLIKCHKSTQSRIFSSADETLCTLVKIWEVLIEREPVDVLVKGNKTIIYHMLLNISLHKVTKDSLSVIPTGNFTPDLLARNKLVLILQYWSRYCLKAVMI